MPATASEVVRSFHQIVLGDQKVQPHVISEATDISTKAEVLLERN